MTSLLEISPATSCGTCDTPAVGSRSRLRAISTELAARPAPTTRAPKATTVRVSPLPAFRAPRRNDIEGLRALAVLAVLAFHASVPGLAGGFVGVDVFFVISGFLITSLLLAEARDTGRVRLGEFYARRARRILPAAAVTLVVTAFTAYLVLPPLRMRDVAQDLLSSGLYAGNWRFIGLDTDYLTENRAPSPVLHFWSLAVEEQFYLVWPLLVLGAFLLARSRRRRLIGLLAGILGTATVASYALSAHWTHTSAPLAYLSSPSRAWQFGAGALLAVAGPWLVRRGRVARGVATIVGWAGLAGVLTACVAFDSTTPYPGTAALLPTLATVAMILGGTVAGERTGTVGGVLALSPLRAIGRLSYAWYLWHWPALVLVQAQFGPQSWGVQVLIVAGAAVPAYLTLRLVERPIRFNRTIATRPSSGLAVGLIATIAAVSAALTAGSVATDTLLGPATASSATAASTGGSTGTTRTPAVTLATVFAPAALRRNSGAVTPSALAARTDFPHGRCITDLGSSTLQLCRFGHLGGPVLMLFGDSHAHQWETGFEQVALSRGWELDILAHSGCPVAPKPHDAHDADQPSCDAWRTSAVAKIVSIRPALIVVSSYAQYLYKTVDRRPAWDSTLAKLRPSGAKIAYLRDTPTMDLDVPACISGHLSDWSACTAPKSEAVRPDTVIEAVAAGKEPGLSVLDMTPYLCPAARCPAVRGGALLYRDDTHLTASFATLMAPALARGLSADGLMPAAR